MSKIFNQSPYFDDFDSAKNFYKILLRPGYALQTREFNQAQSILQNQVESVGNHLFKDGAMVIPGFISFDNNVDALKLQATNATTDNVALFLSQFKNKIITGTVSGAQALVVHYEQDAGAEPNTLYIRYITSGTTNVTFLDNEGIYSDDILPYTALTATSSALSTGSLAILQDGIYYIKGYFVLVQASTIALDKYGVSPSYRVGLQVTEDIITPDDDETLNDNSIGSYNSNAPGAHRYKISAVLSKLSLSDTADASFIELLRVQNGVVENKVTSTDYSVLEQTLARRTYDESGDYTVSPFKLQLKEHRNNARGDRANSTGYILGDIIEHVISNVTYTYKCIATGTSGGSAPSYVTTFGTFVDGTVTWEYIENPVYNMGVYATTDTPAGDQSKYVVSVESGKAYVKGFEVDKIGTTNIVVDKPRDYSRVNSGTLTVTAGNYVKVQSVNSVSMFSVPETLGTNFPTIDLYDRFISAGGTAAGTKIGTATVTAIEPDGAANTWKVFINNVLLNSGKTFEKDVKSLYYNNTTLAIDFTGSLLPIPVKLTGSGTVAASTCTGVGTLFLTELAVGDYITFDQVTWYVVATIPFNVQFTVTGTPTATGLAIYKSRSTIYEPNAFAAYIPFPASYLRNVKSADDSTNDTVYTITRNFGTLAATAGVITITLAAVGETFASIGNASNYLVFLNSTGVQQAPSYGVSGDSKTLTISGLSGSSIYTVLGTVQKSAAQRSKTLNISSPVDYTTASTAQAAIISLGKADCYQLLSVKVAPTFGAITGGNLATVDITNNYIFNSGQQTTHYGVGYITLKAGYAPPAGSIRVVFEYFTHGAGDYFSIDSYTNVIPYGNVEYPLRDGLDFRPSLNDAGTAFDGTNSGVLKRGYNITADYSYYLPRIDTLSVDINGDFFITKGVSSLNPVTPTTVKQSMLLAVLNMQPYGIDTTANSILLNVIDNKRYTMRDIGAIEKRVTNIEYYTSLSLLEQETKGLSILDSDGLDRFKNGFLVDAFSDHGIGATDSLDYKCSIDAQNKELRPQHNTRSVSLIEKNANTAQRTASGYAITGDIITLPYISIPLVSQPYASRVKNVNPFAIFTFIGSVAFTPSSDNWFEEKQMPDIVVNKEGNYTSTVERLAATGSLGNVWGSWQTLWTGRQLPVLSNGGHNASFGTVTNLGFTSEAVPGMAWPMRTANLQVSTIDTVVSGRRGVNTTVVAKIDTHIIDDKVISTATIPFMRSTNVAFLTRGLKPNTIFYPFFDNVTVSAYVTPATKIKVTAIGTNISTFTYTANAGASGSAASRQIGGKVDSALMNGDIITGATSGATGILCLQENRTNGDIYLYVNNVIGTFAISEVVTGNISGARGTIQAVTLSVAGNTLVSNINGDVCGIFNIPNTAKLNFRTGARQFILTTEADNAYTRTSLGAGTFTSTGLLLTKQRTIESVRNAQVVTTQIAENNSVVTKGSTVINTWYDPLAQTFLINQNGGAFLTKVDIYFGSKDTNIPVRLEIREVENGYPGKTILPMSTVVLTPDQVSVSASSVVDASGLTYAKDDLPTSFVFPSPVYVKNNTEYCVVLLSDSNNYNVWIAQLGDKQVASDRYISEQPYAGVLFESQNASTWTANQLQDLKFVIHRAQFTTNVAGTAIFTNNILPKDMLSDNPIQTCNGSANFRVYHYNHGVTAGDYVQLDGIVAGTYNGIPSTEIVGSMKLVASADLDSYMISAVTTATATGFTGGSGIYATTSAKYDAMEIDLQTQEFPESTISYGIKTTTPAYVKDASFSGVSIGDTIELDSSRIVASDENEQRTLAEKSLEISATLITTNDAISPVIDTHRTSMICTTNRINTPSIALNISPIDYRSLASASTVIGVDGTAETFTTSDAAMKLVFLTATVGKYLTVSGFANGANNGVHLITSVATDGSTIGVSTNLVTEAAGSAITITIGENYINEIAPINSSGIAKYVTKIVTLGNLSTSFRLMFAYNKPVEANIAVYYRIGNSSAIDALNLSKYTLLTNSGLVSTDNDLFTDATYDATALVSFNAIQVKLVFTSSTTAKIPTLKDFRLIALA